MPGSDAYTVANRALELSGKHQGSLRSVSGGDAYGQVVVEPEGADGIAHKHIADVAYSDIQFACEAPLGPELVSWISDLCNRKPQPRDGQIIASDFRNEQVEGLSFTGSWLREVAIPRLDAASMDVLEFGFRVAPERTTQFAGQGKSLPIATRVPRLSSNFRLAIGGLDCTTVARIEPIVVRQQGPQSFAGEQRDAKARPAGVEISDLVVTFDARALPSWRAWHTDFLVAGSNNERSATIELLDSTMKNVWGSIVLKGLGIHQLRTAEISQAQVGGKSASVATIQRQHFTAHMYCEDIALSFAPVAVASVPADVTADPACDVYTGPGFGTQIPSRVDVIPALGMLQSADRSGAHDSAVLSRVRHPAW
jgi:hypothetical protein